MKRLFINIFDGVFEWFLGLGELRGGLLTVFIIVGLPLILTCLLWAQSGGSAIQVPVPQNTGFIVTP